jgi:hypothetical protein
MVSSLYDEYKSTSEFVAAVAKSERQLEEDKRRLKQMADWRRYAKRRAEREVELFRTDEDKHQRFPTPLDRWRR